MRAIERTSRFKRDYRREKSGVLSKKLDQLLTEVVDLLAADTPLPHRCFDHPLSGEWSGFRDCHIRPDLVLIYEKPDARIRCAWCGSARTASWVFRRPCHEQVRYPAR
jgi:mRNA interferase YafQ